MSITSYKGVPLTEHHKAVQALMLEDVRTQQNILDLLVSKQITPLEYGNKQDERHQEFKAKMDILDTNP